jgi:short-subunit dehydrogenase
VTSSGSAPVPVWWITGASDGIGRALAFAAVSAGAKVVLTARREERLAGIVRELGEDRAASLPADVTTADPDVLTTQAEAIFGPVSVFVANAGVTQRATALDTRIHVVREIMELNFFAPVALTGAVAPRMVQRGRGSLVYVSSLAGHVGTPLRSTYSASKHALQGWTESLRAELAGTGVRVTVVAPGYIQTNISLNARSGDGSAYGRMGHGNRNGLSAEVCAVRMLRAIQAGQDEVFIGGREVWAVYLHRLWPGLVRRYLPGAAPHDEG